VGTLPNSKSVKKIQEEQKVRSIDDMVEQRKKSEKQVALKNDQSGHY